MIRIGYICDLPFGTHLPRLAGIERGDLPDATVTAVLSGDVTQRARPQEFAAAAEFVRTLPAPVLVVTGNHDSPAGVPCGGSSIPGAIGGATFHDRKAPQIRAGVR